jgi:hypothetical protein
VRSTAVPVGMSTTTWNSLLLSNGSIFITTSFSGTSTTDTTIATPMPIHSMRRYGLPASSRKKGVITRVKKLASRCDSLSAAAGAAWLPKCLCSRRNASHGVTTNAIASDSSIPIDELIGIGAM